MDHSLHWLMHGTAIRKHGKIEDIAAVAGLDPQAAATLMAGAVESGRAVDVDGSYMLSPAGNMILSSEYSRFCGVLRNDDAFVAAWQRFEQINDQLKGLITRWQTIEIGGKRVPNDHTDSEYDENVIGELGDLHERFEPIINDLVAGAPRLAVYRDRLETALDKAESGATEWVSDARIDSYHTVWFELHEDLLRLLGKQRQE